MPELKPPGHRALDLRRRFSCHAGAQFTDANSPLHPPADWVVEPEVPSYASRSATKVYRTTPLKGIWQRPPYFHAGSAVTLENDGRAYSSKLRFPADGAADR